MDVVNLPEQLDAIADETALLAFAQQPEAERQLTPALEGVLAEVGGPAALQRLVCEIVM
jgi:hypothetical protein